MIKNIEEASMILKSLGFSYYHDTELGYYVVADDEVHKEFKDVKEVLAFTNMQTMIPVKNI